MKGRCLFLMIVLSILWYGTFGASKAVSTTTTAAREGWGLLRKTKEVLDNFYGELTEEVRYRKSNIDQYRDEISERVSESIERLRRDQLRAQTRAERDLDSYMKKLNKLYTDNLLSLGKQQKAIQDLSKKKVVQRPAAMDDSLEQFRKFYDESVTMSPYQVAKNFWESSWDFLSTLSPAKSENADFMTIEKRIDKQIEALTQRLQSRVQDAVESASEGAENLERVFRNAAGDLTRVPEDIISNARKLAVSSQTSIQKTIDKSDVRRETRDLEVKLKALSREGTRWMEEKLQMVETSFKTMQESLQQRNAEFESMISKRRASMQYSSMNDAALNQILKLIDPAEKGWKLIKEEDGYEVYRKFLGFGPSSQYACVMCHGVINSPPKAVLSLFEDNSRVSEYNSFCKEIRDLEYIGEDTKVQQDHFRKSPAAIIVPHYHQPRFSAHLTFAGLVVMSFHPSFPDTPTTQSLSRLCGSAPPPSFPSNLAISVLWCTFVSSRTGPSSSSIAPPSTPSLPRRATTSARRSSSRPISSNRCLGTRYVMFDGDDVR